jgi:hypothetical protein
VCLNSDEHDKLDVSMRYVLDSFENTGCNYPAVQLNSTRVDNSIESVIYEDNNLKEIIGTLPEYTQIIERSTLELHAVKNL